MRKIRFWMWCLASIVAGILLGAVYQSGSGLPKQVDQVAGVLLALGILGIVVWAIRGWRGKKQANAQPVVEDDPDRELRMQVETEELEARRAVAKLRLAEAEKKLNDLNEDQVSEKPLIEKKGLRLQPLLPSSELLPSGSGPTCRHAIRSDLDRHASEYPRNSISN